MFACEKDGFLLFGFYFFQKDMIRPNAQLFDIELSKPENLSRPFIYDVFCTEVGLNFFQLAL